MQTDGPESPASDVGFDTFDPRAIARPHAYYAELREHAPIVWSEQMQAWVLTRYEDVRSVLRDHDRWSSHRSNAQEQRARRLGRRLEQVAPADTLTMLNADRPDHTRLRKLLALDFTPGRIGHIDPHVGEIAEKLLAGAADAEVFDVAEELAVGLPVTVIAELLGIPPELGDQFKRWSDAATEPMHPDSSDAEVDARNRQIVEFREYLNAQIADRRRVPTDDFIGRLVAAHDDEDKLTDAELLAAVNLLLLAGNETTTNLISNATLALWKFPQQQQRLRDDPDLIDTAIEEFLRYDGSVQFTTRVAMEPARFHGQEVRTGEAVAVFLASANRDPRMFADPDVLDFGRERKKHVAFGDWIHICIGQFLARMETRAAILGLLRAFPDFELAVDEDEIVYRPNFNLRGPKHLPIRRVTRPAL